MVFVELRSERSSTAQRMGGLFERIIQVKLDGSQVRRLVHHRSRPFNSYVFQRRFRPAATEAE